MCFFFLIWRKKLSQRENIEKKLEIKRRRNAWFIESASASDFSIFQILFKLFLSFNAGINLEGSRHYA